MPYGDTQKYGNGKIPVEGNACLWYNSDVAAKAGLRLCRRGKFMRNKSKLNKIKQNNRKPAADVPAEWFYMSAAECSAGAIKEVLADTACEVEYWEAAQVLEIVLGEGSSMDVEVLEPDFQDEYSNAFLAEHRIRFLCSVTLKPEDYDKAREVMEHISSKIGGFFCGDTEDFTPVVGEME